MAGQKQIAAIEEMLKDKRAERYKAADESIKQAISYTHTKFEREAIEKQFEEVEKKAKQFGRRLNPR